MTPAALHRPTADRPLPPISAALYGVTLLVLAWETRRRMRRDLQRLDAHLLRDIGLDPAAAAAEAQKPFWRD